VALLALVLFLPIDSWWVLAFADLLFAWRACGTSRPCSSASSTWSPPYPHLSVSHVSCLFLRRVATQLQPSSAASPLAGHLADRFGAEALVPAALLLSLVWFPLLGLKSSLAGFIIIFMLSQTLLACVMR
jgi:hypothetical protein